MILKNISLKNFRNYKNESFDFSENINIICGNNAQGKTNIVEAVYFLVMGKSFRAVKNTELINFDSEFSSISADIMAYNREINLKYNIFKDKRDEFFIDDVKSKKEKFLNLVIFTPDDLFLIKEGPEKRRKFMDMALCQLRPKYMTILKEYNKLLKEKNKILKSLDEKPQYIDLLDIYSERMIVFASQIIWYRAMFINKINDFAKIHHSDIAKSEILNIQYKTNITNIYAKPSEIAKELTDYYYSHKEIEIRSRSCLCGTHRDDFNIYINNFEAKKYASQGQMRSACIALKMAERDLFFSDTGAYPLLILDDVLSELDTQRQEFILNKILSSQLIITCCEEKDFLSGKTIFIENGKKI